MSGRGYRCCLAAGLGILCLLMSPAADGAQRKTRRKPATPQRPAPQAVVPEQPAPIPATLAQKPAVPPRVEYRNGQLAIVAENSTLGDILRAVHQQTGAAIEIPPNVSERVVTRLGPGPANDVLAALLNGSSFNYVMLGSPDDPTAVARLIVTARLAGGEGPVAGNFQPPPSGARPGVAFTPPPQPPATEDDSDEDLQYQNPAEQPTEEQAEGEQTEEQMEGQPQPQQPGGQPVVKTPEQLLQELQRQQQLQQQQHQQTPQAAPQGFPIPPGAPQQPPDQNAQPPE